MLARDLPVVGEDAGTVEMLAAMLAHETDAVLVRDSGSRRMLTAGEVMTAHNAAIERHSGRMVRARDIASVENQRIVSAPEDVRHLVADMGWNLLRGSTSFADPLTSALTAGFGRTGAALMWLGSFAGTERVVTNHETVVSWSGQCQCKGPEPDVHYFTASETRSFPDPSKCKYFHGAALICR